MSTISDNINELKSQIPKNVKLVAVSKTHPIVDIIDAYNAGQVHFGENKAQELSSKHEELKKDDIKWHFIGHLQTNKVKYIIPFIELIHSVDSLKLLTEINRQSAINNRITNCLLQFHIATEETKFGFNISELTEMMNSQEFKDLKNVCICGVMGMASFTEDVDLIRSEFRGLKEIFDTIKEKYFLKNDSFCELSMGMSSDWNIAIEEGSTIIRVGSIIFGNRNYNSN